MKKMMGLMVYGGILFGLSAGGAWFLRSKHMQELQQVKEEHAPDPDSLLVDSTTHSPTVTHPELPADQRQDVLNRVPVRPEAITAEEIVRQGMNLKKRDEAIRERELALQRVEAQYTLMLNEIKGEQREIEGLVVQARQQRQAADEILRQASARHQEAASLYEKADAIKAETQKLRDQIEDEQRNSSTQLTPPAATNPLLALGPSPADRDTNLKDLTKVMQSMKPAVGAGILSEFMDDAKTDIALQLIARLEKETAAKILDEMGQQDGGTEKVTLLLEKFTEMSNTAPDPKKKRGR